MNLVEKFEEVVAGGDLEELQLLGDEASWFQNKADYVIN